MNVTVVRSLLVLGVCAVLAGGATAVAAEAKAKEAAAKSASSSLMTPMELRNAMRMLWEEHISYTSSFITSSLAGLEDAGPVAERLLRNQDDIGNAIKPFYGEEAGKKLSALLRDHILIAADIVKAAKGGDNPGVDAGQQRWSQNANDLAAFLSGANPNWPLPALKEMLSAHLSWTTAEVVSRLKKDWAADITARDKGHAHILQMADALSDGIIKQFPKKFRK